MSNTKNIPFFNYPALFKQHEQEYMDILHDVLSRGAYILQEDLLEFEKNLSEFLGIKHVFGVADGTNALILALHAAGIGQGDEVILPSHTYVATAASVHMVGAKPVLVECGRDHMIDVDSAKKHVTKNTKAIMPVQLNGRTSNMDAVREIADELGLTIIEDSAQALGSKYKGNPAGGFGFAGTFSFYPAKLLGCFGDGGAVVTNDDDAAEKLFLLRDHGRDHEGEVVGWGTNSRLDNMQAAILNFKLKTYSDDIKRRREIAARYEKGLSSLDTLLLPPAPVANSDHFDVYQNYEIEADSRDRLKEYLADKGIGTIVQFGGKPVHKYPLGFEDVSLPYTESVYDKALLLPMHMALSDEEVDYVIDAIQTFYI